MAKIDGYKDLIAWQKGMDLVEAVYRLSAGFPREERFGLTSQVRRAAVSVPSNIAEGYSRPNRSDYVRFLDIARGSATKWRPNC
jgi:four helix bundle protein